METISVVTGAIALGKTLLDAIKAASGMVTKKDNPQLQETLYDIRKNAFDLQETLLELKIENEELRDEIKKLKDISDMENKLERYEGKTYLTLPNDDGTKRYICSTCWEKERITVSLAVRNISNDKTRKFYRCPNCNNSDYIP